MPHGRSRAARLSPEEAFAQALKRARKQHKMSQELLGFESGYHRTHISLLERGKMNPSLRTILSLAAALQILAAELVRAGGAVVERNLAAPAEAIERDIVSSANLACPSYEQPTKERVRSAPVFGD